ncbi:hypothetical protein INT44_005835 [Umbelopsis vinacea]|uniref:PHD-type domain-containing protein n=1 Tax=Umbelopsis vinacea TaxID=44442 RepID=A0A8H7Q0L3_9FUNG|nr:hypothetical protein INT44_005835 [Umbelopsis vinacea]
MSNLPGRNPRLYYDQDIRLRPHASSETPQNHGNSYQYPTYHNKAEYYTIFNGAQKLLPSRMQPQHDLPYFDKPKETRKIFTGVKVAQPRTVTRKIDETFRVSKHTSAGPRKMMMSLKKKNVENSSSATTLQVSFDNAEDEDMFSSCQDVEDTANLDPLQDRKPINKYRLKNQKWTRWDVVDSQDLIFPESEENSNTVNPSGENDATIEASQPNGDYVEKSTDNDIEISIADSKEEDDALQSDDDVVGPWHEGTPPIELHSMEASSSSQVQDTRILEKTAVQTWKEIQDLNPDATSVASASDIPIFNATTSASSSTLVSLTKDNVSGFVAPNSKAITANRKVKVMDTVVARKATTKAKAKPQHPPTKSSYAIKTDKKMKQQTASKGKKGKKKVKKQVKKSTQPQEEFSTTGAFLTRGTARQLAGPYGFQPNPFNYHHKQSVEVLNINGCWYSGVLMEMNGGRVKVKYIDWKEHEWIIVGSRRLRPVVEPVTVDEAVAVNENQPGSSLTAVGTENNENKVTSNADLLVANPTNLLNGNNLILQGICGETESVKEGDMLQQEIQDPSETSVQTPGDPGSALPIKKRVIAEPVIHEYRTTGAFATRNTLRELADPHGFTPNAYGYSYQCRVEVLNVKKFWEPGNLVAMDKNRVKVRFEGWGEESDEWITLGSRRLRVMAQVDHENSLESLLVHELNPELLDEARRPTKRRVLGPDDEFWITQARLYEEAERNKKRRGKPKDDDTENSQDNLAMAEVEKENKQELAMFPPNIYGYYLMQHVHVLQMDRKFYEARLVAMANGKVKVHYCGWNKKLEEAVTCGSPRIQPWRGGDINICVEPEYVAGVQVIQSVPEILPPTDEVQPSIPNFVRRSVRTRKPTYKCREGSPSEFSSATLWLHPFGVPDEDKEIEVRNHLRKIKQRFIEQPEYYNEMDLDADGNGDIATVIFCKQCRVVINKFRYYCTYCEAPGESQTIQTFDLCLKCFDQDFPFWHEHPRSGFAVQALLETKDDALEYISPSWEEDVIDPDYVPDATDECFLTNAPIESDEGYKYLSQWKKRKICALCNDDDTSADLGGFVGPFIIETFNKRGEEKRKSFWIHDACGRYSPEVVVTKENKWYNVTIALRRGRGVKCAACKEKGATIGCFDGDCNKSFHIPCTRKPINYFKKGVIFWCPGHEEYYNKKDTYVNIFHCDACSRKMEQNTWFSCLPCSQEYFSTFDLCLECFEGSGRSNHEHDEDCFEETSMEIIKEMEAQEAAEKARKKAEARAARAATKKCNLFPRRDHKKGLYCSYCNTQETVRWRKGFDGVLMCEACFELASLDLIQDELPLVLDEEADHTYAASIEDYSHKPYLTREALSSTKFDDMKSNAVRLATYAPVEHQLFSLSFDSTYFDIPGRAPRWASHSGTDYHGTWLPQTVRRAILRHTRKDDRILSNFLGRGTDAIECFLLQRRCCGVDINPAAVSLSQRSCSFETPPGLTTAEHRPIIVQADSRKLTGALFADESYDHVLSHPPYKDCVAYSLHIEGDLSRYTNPLDFQEQYDKCVRESWRLLKMDRRLTLGIGDNREHCFYIPVGFQLIRLYINDGFELEELIIKRQRYCSAFGLGTYLCVQFDFLVFTHEFIATFRKVPRNSNDKMDSFDASNTKSQMRITYTCREIPRSPIARKSVVMGTVWLFKPSSRHSFAQLCTSRMVERFGKDESNWEHVELDIMSDNNDPISKTSLANIATDSMIVEDEELSISSYEVERQKRIDENRLALLQLGLISDLSEESSDFTHYEAMIRKAALPYPAPLTVRVVTHIPHHFLKRDYIPLYRENVVQVAQDSVTKLAVGGMFIVGTQDYRDDEGKLWPMSMLIMEDINRHIGENILKLKEMVVTVPEGHSKDRSKPMSFDTYEPEVCLLDIDEAQKHEIEVPIVHAIYLVFMKMGPSAQNH